MILIELDTGTEELFKSPEELAAAIRRGAIGPKSRIYHRGSARWLPITVHPEFRKVAAERANQPLPPLKRKQWTFFAANGQDEQPVEEVQATLPSPVSETVEEPARPRWRRVLGKVFGNGRAPKTA